MTPATRQGLDDLIERTVSVPTIPAIRLRIDRILTSEDSTAPDVARAISRDPALASKVLRIANSAYYGLKAQVTSLDLAVALLWTRSPTPPRARHCAPRSSGNTRCGPPWRRR